jgi:hypothetical protein
MSLLEFLLQHRELLAVPEQLKSRMTWDLKFVIFLKPLRFGRVVRAAS